MITYKKPDKNYLKQKTYIDAGVVKHRNFCIQYWIRESDNIPFNKLIGILIKDDVCILEKEIPFFNLQEAKLYLKEYLLKEFDRKETFDKIKSLFKNDDKAHYNIKITGYNEQEFFTNEDLVCAKLEALEHNFNDVNNDYSFVKYEELVIKSNQIIKELNKYKKQNIHFLFIDRTSEFKIPTIECVLINKNWFNLDLSGCDFEKHLLKHYFACGKSAEEAILKGIKKLFYEGTKTINIFKKEFIKSTKSECDISYKNIDFICKNLICYSSGNIYNQYTVSLDAFKIDFERFKSYEDFLKELIFDNPYSVRNIKFNMHYLNNKPLKDINLYILQDYLTLLGCILNNDKRFIEEKIWDLKEFGMPLHLSEDVKNNNVLTLLNFYMSYKSINTPDEQIWLYADEIFGDKNMLKILREIIEEKRDIFDNPYIFKIEVI